MPKKISNIFIRHPFNRTTRFKGMSYEDIIYEDFKEYKYEDNKFSISQINTLDIEDILKDKEEYINILNTMQKDYKISLLFITDIINNGSYLLYNKDSESIIKNAFNLKEIMKAYILMV